jgi:undecaprenyl-diphosphatase
VSVSRRLWAAVFLLVAYLALGFAVSRLPVDEIDRGVHVFAGHSTGAALFLTRSGTFVVYAVLCALTLLIGILRRAWFPSTLVIVGTFLCSWFSSDLFKELFRRARPEHWYGMQETSFAYSSGHATLSLVFYGLWAYLLWRTIPPAPWRTVLIAALGCWVVAIGWSRLALGAHYPTDLLGGYLLGSIWLLLGMTAIDYFTEQSHAAT